MISNLHKILLNKIEKNIFYCWKFHNLANSCAIVRFVYICTNKNVTVIYASVNQYHILLYFSLKIGINRKYIRPLHFYKSPINRKICQIN